MQLSTTKSNAFADMLISFAGGSLEKFSQEATNRTIFVTNVMKALSEIEINDETSESVDTLMDLILSYDISIFDLYAYCGTSEVSAEKLTTFFANYKSYFNNRKSQLLEKIYLSITSDTIANNENYAVLDVIHKINKVYLVENKYRITPIIKFFYVLPDSATYFVNDLSAINEFYRNENIRNAVNASRNISNNELKLLYNNLKSSYDDREFYLYRFSQKSTSYKLISFIMNYRVKSSTTDIFYNNVYVDDVPGLLRLLTEDIYKLYMADIVKYENRNKQFKPSEYYPKLTVAALKDITMDTYKYEFFKAMIISGKQSIMKNYTNEISAMQTYIKSICDTAVTDPRYVLGE